MTRPAKLSPKLLLILAAVVLGLSLTAWAVRVATLPLVQVTRLTRGPVVQAFYANGSIAPEREYSIRANTAGILFLEPGIDKGAAVKRGQRLARAVSDDLEQKLRQAQAELREKTARADEKASPVLAEFDRRVEAFAEIQRLGRAELKRLLGLTETGSATPIEVERAQDRIATATGELEAHKAQRAAKLLELRKDLEVAQGAYDIAKWNADQQDIHAPIDGVILDRPTPDRTRLAINEQIMLIADVHPEHLVMRAAVDEEDKNKLRVGQVVKLTLYSFPDTGFLGRVKTIYDKADPQRRFEVDVDNLRPDPPTQATTQPTTQPTAPRFAPGMTGELAFIEKERDSADLLPRQALQGDHFYVIRDNKLHRLPASAGVRNVTRVEVLAGLNPDDQVLLSPIGKLEPGQRVRTDFIDPRTAADLNKPPETQVFKGGF